MEQRADFEVDVKFSVKDLEEITREAVNQLAKDLEAAVRADIASAGMARFANRTKVSVRGKQGKGFVVNVNARPGWMKAFENGAVSVGEPMLWMAVPGATYPHQKARNYPVKL